MAVRKRNEEGIELYPFDIEALEKGDHIPVEMCEPYTKSKDRNHKLYSLELEQLKENIEKRLREIGRNWTLCCPRGGITVLTDQDAVAYLQRRWRIHEAGLRCGHRKLVGVEVANLDAATAKVHERALVCQTMKLSALRRAGHQAHLSASKRTTPGLPGKTS